MSVLLGVDDVKLMVLLCVDVVKLMECLDVWMMTCSVMCGCCEVDDLFCDVWML